MRTRQCLGRREQQRGPGLMQSGGQGGFFYVVKGRWQSVGTCSAYRHCATVTWPVQLRRASKGSTVRIKGLDHWPRGGFVTDNCFNECLLDAAAPDGTFLGLVWGAHGNDAVPASRIQEGSAVGD